MRAGQAAFLLGTIRRLQRVRPPGSSLGGGGVGGRPPRPPRGSARPGSVTSPCTFAETLGLAHGRTFSTKHLLNARTRKKRPLTPDTSRVKRLTAAPRTWLSSDSDGPGPGPPAPKQGSSGHGRGQQGHAPQEAPSGPGQARALPPQPHPAGSSLSAVTFQFSDRERKPEATEQQHVCPASSC